MESKTELGMCLDALGTVSSCLGKLNNMIASVCMGMQHEGMEQQTVDCVECIGFYVEYIKHMADDCIGQAEKNQNI